MDQNEEIFARYMNDDSFSIVVAALMASEAYRKLRGANKSPTHNPPVKTLS